MFGGELIYQTSDECGKLQIVDHKIEFRSLHFNNKTQQSAMLLKNPYLLVHRYTQAMVLPLVWMLPQKALVLGLGAGSISKYIYNYFPQVSVHSVELRKVVIDLAREYFLLPDESEKFIITQDDALNWILNSTLEDEYDLIFADMFITSVVGADHEVRMENYYEKMLQLLTSSGVIVFNQLGGKKTRQPIIDAFRVHSDELYFYETQVDNANTITFVSKSPFPGEITDKTFFDYESSFLCPAKQYFEKLNSIE